MTGNFWPWCRGSSLRGDPRRWLLHARAAQGSFTTPAFPRVKHESAAVEESLSVQQGLCALVFSAKPERGATKLASVVRH